MNGFRLQKLRSLANPRNWHAYSFRLRNRITRLVTGKTYIFIERRAGIGDIICTFPAVLSLRKKYPHSHIVYATRKEFMSIVRMGRCADLVMDVNDLDTGPWMAESDFNLVYRPRVGDEKQPPQPSIEYLVDQFCDALNVQTLDRQPKLFPADEIKDRILRQLKTLTGGKKPVIGIHTGPTWPVKQWIPAEWDRLANMLREQMNGSVIQLGSDVDTGKGPVKSARVSGTTDWVNLFSLEETAAAISQLNLFIGIDSGLLHIAGAVGTPVVGLYGAIRPGLSLPPIRAAVGITSDVPCLGCHHLLPMGHWKTGCPNDIICMKQLSAERVFQACQQLLSATRGKQNEPAPQ